MSHISPLTFAVVQNIQAHQQANDSRNRTVRRAQVEEKDSAEHEDVVEHQVESAEEIRPVGEDHGQHPGRQQRRKNSKQQDNGEDEEEKHIDLTA